MLDWSKMRPTPDTESVERVRLEKLHRTHRDALLKRNRFLYVNRRPSATYRNCRLSSGT